MPRLFALLATAAFAVTPRRRKPVTERRTSPTNPDFETGDLTGWTIVEGDAFTDASVTDQIAYSKGLFHHHGRYHLFGGAEGDHKVGVLESDVFTVDTDAISFLISGGNDPELLRVELVRAADDVVLHCQTGPDDEAYVRITWDVARWRETRVFFRIVDASRFGHLNIDDIRTVEARRADNGLTFAALGQDNQPDPANGLTAAHYAADPLRPRYHYTPYQGWIDGPGALAEWSGRYHLFVRHNPERARPGATFWAHADGPDPVHFTALPPALAPPPPAVPDDRSGVHGGSAVDDDGVLTLVYTSHTDSAARPFAVPETIDLATSEDGTWFVPYENNPIVRTPPRGAIEFRDPEVFRSPDDERWLMVVGSGDGMRGGAHLYASDDLRQWDYEGLLFAGDSEQVWSNPQFFPLDGRWVLLYSAIESGETSYVVGDFDGRAFTARYAGALDHGPDFFAAHHFADAGRDIVIGWMDAEHNRQPCRVNGHAGALSIPREVFLRADGGLGSRPVSDVDRLHKGDVLEGPASGPIGPLPRRIAFGDALDIGIVVNVADSTPMWTLALHRSEAERVELRYDALEKTCTLDTSRAGYGTPHVREVGLAPDAGGRIRLRVLLDRSSIEVFTGDGTALSARVYPRYVESREVRVEPCGGSVWVEHMWAFGMGSCWT